MDRLFYPPAELRDDASVDAFLEQRGMAPPELRTACLQCPDWPGHVGTLLAGHYRFLAHREVAHGPNSRSELHPTSGQRKMIPLSSV
jgi:hypothetical protein